MTIGDPAISGQRLRTAREEFYLRLARLLWHDVMDGIVSLKRPHVRKELLRIMKLARATQADL